MAKRFTPFRHPSAFRDYFRRSAPHGNQKNHRTVLKDETAALAANKLKKKSSSLVND
jgi:hypothetical protein